ncbi:MAG: tyrosine-type recombinase/integrase, partial [Polyangiaceae bacterium]
MAVVPRKTKTGTTYRITFRDADGKQVWERSGSDRREAQSLERQRLREVRSGTFARGKRPSMPFGEFLVGWGKDRRNRNASDDRRIIDGHLRSRSWLADLPCEELRPRHAERLVRELLDTVSSHTGRALGEKYVSNIYGLFCTACSDARRQELMFVDPCILPRGLLSRKHRRGTRQPYAVENVIRLSVQETEAGVFATLALLTGMREGEICGLRWRDIDDAATPLGSIHLTAQYDGQPLKTERGQGERSRKIPIHPELARKLAWWRDAGFELVNCRKPGPADFIVARRERGSLDRLVNHTKKSGANLWARACQEAGVESQTLHATRHTFITLARRGGARAEVVERITHNSSGTIVDHYTHWDWEPLCEAVLAIRLPEPVAKNVAALAARPIFSEKTEWRRRELNPGPQGI